MNNIVTVVLDNPTYATAPQIYQYNYGQILRIQGGAFPKAVEVHFSIQEKSGDSITRIGTTADGVTEVPIPELMLENYDSIENYDFWAYIYVEDGTSGTTECKIRIPVKARSKPEVPGTPEEPELFRETVKAVNDAADRAETAEQNAKASETEAGKYAASASESAAAAEKTKEDALKEVGEKKQKAIEAIQEQEETSVGKIINHTDDEIQQILNQTADSKRELEQTIANASSSKEELDESIQTAGDTKTALDKSTELAGTAKTELDTSTQKAGEAKTALDGSAKTASEMQETLSETVKQAGALDTSLGEKIETETQLKTDLVASGEKAVQDIQTAGSEQLDKMQTVAEEFTTDREQITTNKEDISSLKEELSKNYLDDAKTKRSLDALWKLNQGISYQFETDAERAYQKDIPSGAKLVSVKKIGGRTIVWNQLINPDALVARYGNIQIEDTKIIYTVNSVHAAARIDTNVAPIAGHKYFLSKTILSPHATATANSRLTDNGSYAIEANQKTTVQYIQEATTSDASAVVRCYFPTNGESDSFEVGDTIEISNFMLADLTKMFDSGNEPATVEEFKALFPEDYYEYNEGTLMSMPVNEVVEHGRNLWDEEWEHGSIDIKTGDNRSSASGIRTKNYISIQPDVEYYVFFTNQTGAVLKSRFYDQDKNYIGPTQDDGSQIVYNIKFITPSKARYMKFATQDDYGKVYNNDILVTVKNNNLYTSYRKNTYPIPQAILELDGYGDGVNDDVYNYVDWEEKKYHKRVGKYIVDGSEAIAKEKSYWIMTVTDFEKPRPSTINAICTNFKAGKAFFNKWGNIIFRSSSNGFVFTDAESKFANANEVKNYFQQNNETIYYELDEEQIIDISDIIDNTFQGPFEVEAGGTLTFQNSNGDGYRLPIPNEEEYIVSLAEVGGGASE